MKKKVLLFLCVLFLFGCQPSQEDLQFQLYNHIKSQLLTRQNWDYDYDFQIRLIYNQLEKNYRYDIIIDQPRDDMYNITAMSVGDEDDDEMCPNVGIFDEDAMHLKKDVIDKTQGFYKGIQLSGTSQKKQVIKVYVSYYRDVQKTKKVEKYIEVKDEVR